MTTFGTAGDVTLEELAIELFFPADGATHESLRATSHAHGDPSRA